MIRKTGKSGFTLIELLVVVGMIAIIMGAISSSMSAAMHRARIQKATSEVKTVMQAILAYENHSKDRDLPNWSAYKELTMENFGFLFGNSDQKSAADQKIPALMAAALMNKKVMLDPWGMPYRVSIRKGTINLGSKLSTQFQSGYYNANFNCLRKSERE